MSADPVCDVIVVGAGISGAWAAKELCESGLSVILLDAGPDVQPDDRVFTAERSEQERERIELQQSIQSRHPAFWTHNPEHFVNDLEHPYVSAGSEPFVWIRGRQVGGRSLLWGGLTLRFGAQQFHESEADGAGPRWPLSYDDLAPHYARVEEFMGVVGSRDGLSQLQTATARRGPHCRKKSSVCGIGSRPCGPNAEWCNAGESDRPIRTAAKAILGGAPPPYSIGCSRPLCALGDCKSGRTASFRPCVRLSPAIV